MVSLSLKTPAPVSKLYSLGLTWPHYLLKPQHLPANWTHLDWLASPDLLKPQHLSANWTHLDWLVSPDLLKPQPLSAHWTHGARRRKAGRRWGDRRATTTTTGLPHRRPLHIPAGLTPPTSDICLYMPMGHFFAPVWARAHMGPWAHGPMGPYAYKCLY